MGKVLQMKVTRETLELAYRHYPRKLGKAKGMKIAWRDVKTQGDAEDLTTAIINYRKYLVANRVSSEFIKHFSTFMASWRDWLDEDHGTSESFDGIKVQDMSDIFGSEE